MRCARGQCKSEGGWMQDTGGVLGGRRAPLRVAVKNRFQKPICVTLAACLPVLLPHETNTGGQAARGTFSVLKVVRGGRTAARGQPYKAATPCELTHLRHARTI